MSKKLEGNGLWESSRMILPEHKERIQEWRQRRNQRSRPELDEQELEHINAAIAWSLQTREPVRLKMYDPYEELALIGVVERVDRQLGRIRVNGDWFKIDDIIGVDIDQ